MPGAARCGADVEDLRRLGREVDGDGDQVGGARRAVGARHGDEEVEHDVLIAGVNEHVAAGAQTRERALGDEGRQHRGHGRVDRVAALAQEPRTSLRGQRMPCSDHAARAHAPQPKREGGC